MTARIFISFSELIHNRGERFKKKRKLNVTVLNDISQARAKKASDF